jgi:hypothetical protein
VPEPYLEEAQDDATYQAVREQEAAASTSCLTEIRRESYFNRFATALDGIDIDNPAESGRNKTRRSCRASSANQAHEAGAGARRRAPARDHGSPIKITVPGRS